LSTSRGVPTEAIGLYHDKNVAGTNEVEQGLQLGSPIPDVRMD
jgi:hypothetical protein